MFSIVALFSTALPLLASPVPSFSARSTEPYTVTAEYVVNDALNAWAKINFLNDDTFQMKSNVQDCTNSTATYLWAVPEGSQVLCSLTNVLPIDVEGISSCEKDSPLCFTVYVAA